MKPMWFDVQLIEQLSVEEVGEKFSEKLRLIQSLNDNRRQQQAHCMQMREVAVQAITRKNRIAGMLLDAKESHQETTSLQKRSDEIEAKVERIKEILMQAEVHHREITVSSEISSYPAAIQEQARALIDQRNAELSESMKCDIQDQSKSSGIYEIVAEWREAKRLGDTTKIKELAEAMAECSNQLSNSILVQRESEAEKAKEIKARYDLLLNNLK